MEIASRINKLMKDKGLSRYKLAKLTGVPYTTLIKIIDGTTKNPQIETLSTIADFLGVSLDRLSGQSVSAIVEDRLALLEITTEALAEAAGVPLEYLRGVDEINPDESDYAAMLRISKVLNMHPGTLRAALARQEPPAYDGPQEGRSLEKIFANEEFNEPTLVPDWATAKDNRDFKKMLEEDAPVMFDGVPIEGEAKQRVMDVLTGLFWEAKEMNKKTYGRKKNKEGPTNDTNG